MSKKQKTKTILQLIFWGCVGYLSYDKWGFNAIIGIVAFIAFVNLWSLGSNKDGESEE